MSKPFECDLAKGLAATLAETSSLSNSINASQHRGRKVRVPGLPPAVRSLPWSKRLRSFREKSS
ncbi:MAG TPA: hypothetical protein VK137_09150 [Planctomycetaceae bacterium]|nr:hypothetical protein [Planctomycetaceae bacterium]